MQGRPPIFVDMRIVDDNGKVLPHDGKAYGDLQVRGPHVISRYFRVCSCPQLPLACSAFHMQKQHVTALSILDRPTVADLSTLGSV